MVTIASGDTLAIFTPLSNEPPSTNFATFDTRNSHPVLDFDDTTEEKAVFTGIMPRNYAGGGVTNTIFFGATSGTAGTVVWQTAFERVGTVLDIDADSFATGNNGTLVVPSTSGSLTSSAIAHTDGAQMDSIAVGEVFRLAVTREVADAQDSLVGDAEIVGIEIKET